MSSLIRLGNIDALYFYRGEWLSVLPVTFSSTNAVILFHGYGANAWDLASFAEYYQQLMPHKNVHDYLWVFPQGLLDLSGGFGDGSQRAWFPISIERLLMQKTADEDFLSYQTIENGDVVLSTLEGLIGELSSREIKSIVLGGFSQGGMLAYHLLPRIISKVSVSVLALFSTVSIEFQRYQSLWQKQVPFQSLKVLLQSHGTSDEVLSYKEGSKLFSYLSNYFQQSEFMEFKGGHTIPENTLRTFFKFL